MDDLKNKTVVVTGGAEGIGYSIAEKFIEQSAKVIIVDINEDKGKAAVETLNNRAVFIKYDLQMEPEGIFKEIIDKFKRIDVLVNNAGVGGNHYYKDQIDINITATIALSLKFYEHMSTNAGGTIINISSILGYRLITFGAVYQATKSAIMAFSRSLGHSKNFEKSGVRVITLCPGFTKTKMTRAFLEEGTVPEEQLAYVKSQIWQDASSVGDAAVAIYKSAPSGSVWLIEGGNLEEIKFQ